MKISCLLGIFAFYLLLSCTKKKRIVPEFYKGSASLTINRKSFESKSGAFKLNKEDTSYFLFVDARDEVFNRTVKLSFSFVSNIKQKQVLLKRNSEDRSLPQACLFIKDKAVLYSYYELIEKDTSQNYFQFTSFDEATGKIKGKFEASFIIDSITNLDPLASDTIFIMNGYFETKLSKIDNN